MIAQFKPAPRLASIAAVVGMALLACFTFTSKAQKAKAAPAVAPPTPAAKIEGEQSRKALRQAYDQLTRDVEESAEILEKLRREFAIPSYIASGDGNQAGPDAETIRRLQTLRAEAVGQFREMESLHKSLATLPRPELRNAIVTATPDALLGTLIERQADAVQKLAALNETHSLEHPEVRSLRRTLETINKQVDERLDGILAGLKVRGEQLRGRVESFDQELDKLKQRDMEAPTRYREYFKRKRELENIQAVRDRLHMRLIEEEIQAGLSADTAAPSIKAGGQ